MTEVKGKFLRGGGATDADAARMHFEGGIPYKKGGEGKESEQRSEDPGAEWGSKGVQPSARFLVIGF